MSEMGQELETWLKRECSDIGTTMFSALHNVEWAYETAFMFERPLLLEARYAVAENIKTILGGAVNSMVSLPESVLTVEDRRKIFDLQEGIKVALDAGDTATIRLKLREMEELTKKYLLEKVVECQCGKPGITKGQILYIKPEFRHIYLDNVTVTVVADDPEHKQVWVKEVASAVNYDHIEFVYP